MSSMRNAVQRRPHRERAQPLERRRLGLLEKHKDYSARAKDYNKKKEQLKRLREKAAERNDDEFYFGMMSRTGPGSRVQDGKGWSGTVLGDRGNARMTVDKVRLLKTQDLGYVRTMRQAISKQLARLEEQFVLTKGLNQLDEEEEESAGEDDDSEFGDLAFSSSKPKPARKIVFMDDEDERDLVIEERMDADDAAAEAAETVDQDDEERTDTEAQRAKSLRILSLRLEHAKKQHKVLSEVEQELEIQQAKMAKTRTSGGTTKKGKVLKVRTRKR